MPDHQGPDDAANGLAIEAVSRLLMLKKSALSRPPAAAKLPAFPGPPEEVARRLAEPPPARAEPNPAPGPLGVPPLALPEAPRGDGPGAAEGAPADVAPTGPTRSNQPPPAIVPAVGSTPTGADARSLLVPTRSDPARPGAEATVLPRIAAPTLDLPPMGEANGRRAVEEGPTARDPGRGAGLAAIGDGVRVGGVGQSVAPPGLFDPHGASTMDPIGCAPMGASSASMPRADAAQGGRGPSAGPRAAVPVVPPGALTVGVPGPLAEGMRNVARATTEPSTGAASSTDLGPSGPAAVDFGLGHATSQSSQGGGASVDLSKTNDLLRQLLDAVKRQRDSSLPVGGPSSYPER